MNFLKKYKFIFISFFIFVVGLSIDQLTKNYAINTIQNLEKKTNYMHRHIPIFKGFNLVLVHNKGISFGIFNNNNIITKYILFCIIIIITLYILYLIFKSKTIYENIPYSMIFTGAIGNIIDRIRYGSVVDFLDFYIMDYHWPSFNIADSFVVLGVFLIIIFDITNKNKKKHVII